MTTEAILAMVAAIGWALCGSLFGLYVGERGRRLDAQRREGVIPVPDDRPAPVVRNPYDPSHGADAELAEPPATFRAQMRDEGYTEEQAAEEWRTLLARGMGDSAQGWMQD